MKKITFFEGGHMGFTTTGAFVISFTFESLRIPLWTLESNEFSFTSVNAMPNFL